MLEKVGSKLSLARCIALATLSMAAAALPTGCAAPVAPAKPMVVDAEVRDCSATIFETLGAMDVAIAIDTSLSTGAPSGSDIDGDGETGAIAASVHTDRGDSRLSAQIAALRRLLESAAGHDIRFSIITYAGPGHAPTRKRPRRVVRKRDAAIRAVLTHDVQALESVLDEVLEGGSKGTSNFYAGMRRASRSLIEAYDPERSSRKVALFISDSPGPTNRDIDGQIKDADERMEAAARQAHRHGIIFNTFGLTEDAELWRGRAIGHIAGATGGSYHAIQDPLQLYCHLAGSLAPASGEL